MKRCVSATSLVTSSRRSTVHRTFRGSPISLAAQRLRIGSAAARTEFPDEAVPPKSTSIRCVSATPLRGVRATSSSGAGASPFAIAFSVVAVRETLPRTIWYAASAVSASLTASIDSPSASSSLLIRVKSSPVAPADCRRLVTCAALSTHFLNSLRPSTTLLAATCSSGCVSGSSRPAASGASCRSG